MAAATFAAGPDARRAMESQVRAGAGAGKCASFPEHVRFNLNERCSGRCHAWRRGPGCGMVALPVPRHRVVEAITAFLFPGYDITWSFVEWRA